MYACICARMCDANVRDAMHALCKKMCIHLLNACMYAYTHGYGRSMHVCIHAHMHVHACGDISDAYV